MFQSNLFQDQVVLVTGGGSGIGKAIARQFLTLGAWVFIASRKEERLQKAHQELSQWGRCDYMVLDIREWDSVQSCMDQIQQKAGRLDILVNNGGGQFPSAADSISAKGWAAVIQTNLTGTFFMTQQCANRFFIPSKKGVIVNIIANIYRGFPGMSHTGAARAGVENLTKTLSVEWAMHHIRINAIAPGIIQSSGLEQYPPELVQGIAAKIPWKRLGTMDEVAWLTLFLASPMASYVIGQTIYVDGGQHLWGDMWDIPDPS